MFIVLIAMGIYEIIDGIKNKNQIYLGVKMNGWIILSGAMLIISAFIFFSLYLNKIPDFLALNITAEYNRLKRKLH